MYLKAEIKTAVNPPGLWVHASRVTVAPHSLDAQGKYHEWLHTTDNDFVMSFIAADLPTVVLKLEQNFNLLEPFTYREGGLWARVEPPEDYEEVED